MNGEKPMRKQTGRGVRAEKAGRSTRPAQPSTEDQSGSTGRRTDPAILDQSKDTGQDHYGQSGFAGKKPGKR